MKKENPILQLSFALALEIINYTQQLEARQKFSIANQLLRSGTSVGANIREAQGAESRADFRHKMKLSYKEAEETRYWLELCHQSDHLPSPPADLIDRMTSIIKILGKIITTSSK